MENTVSRVALIDEKRSSLREVVDSLLEQKIGTAWAEKTNNYAIEYAKHLGGVYGDVWYQGLLPEEYFLDILLPKHRHIVGQPESGDDEVFPIDTSVKDARECFKKADTVLHAECISLVTHLKEEIKAKGFSSSLVLVVIDGKLKHVDGLHRMIALSLLLEEGWKYQPFPVFLCDVTK